jgi:hypothetical protein
MDSPGQNTAAGLHESRDTTVGLRLATPVDLSSGPQCLRKTTTRKHHNQNANWLMPGSCCLISSSSCVHVQSTRMFTLPLTTFRTLAGGCRSRLLCCQHRAKAEAKDRGDGEACRHLTDLVLPPASVRRSQHLSRFAKCPRY